MIARRAFLGGLVRLPLVGGAVGIIGAPTAVAEPVSRQLLFEYRQWLSWERDAIEREMCPGWSSLGGYMEEHRAYDVASFLHGPGPRREHYTGANAGLRSHAYRWHHHGELPASTRAALVMASVGFDWRGTYL